MLVMTRTVAFYIFIFPSVGRGTDGLLIWEVYHGNGRLVLPRLVGLDQDLPSTLRIVFGRLAFLLHSYCILILERL